jgi:hypothetical protein
LIRPMMHLGFEFDDIISAPGLGFTTYTVASARRK